MYGLRIRTIREIRGYSQEVVAESIGVSQSTYSDYENDKIKITVDMLHKIAKKLRVSIVDIMSQQPVIVHLQTDQNVEQSFGNFQKILENQKELYEELLKSKNTEIERLEKIISRLLKDS